MRINRAKIQERAEKLVRQGKIAAAIAEFRVLLKDQPNDINTLNRAGDLLARNGDLAQAVDLFDRVAHLYTLGGFFHKAIAIYKKILKIDPHVVEPRLRLADLYARRDLTTEARIEYMAVIERLVKDGEEAKADEVHDKLVRMEPANVRTRTVLAEFHLAEGDLERGVGELRAAAHDLEGLGLTEESQSVHQRILGLEGAELEAQAGSISALARLGDGDGAVAAGRALRERYPEEPAAAEALIEALELAGRGQEAEALVKEVPGTPASPLVRAVVARIRASEGRPGEATKALLDAARELWKSRRLIEASRVLDQLLGYDPSHREALELRLETARGLDDVETSTRISEKLITEYGEITGEPLIHDVPPAEQGAGAGVQDIVDLGRSLTREEKDFLSEHLTEAEVFIKYGLYDKAIEPLQLVLSRFPSHIEAHVRLKGIYADQGNRTRVLNECVAISELYEKVGRREEAIKALTEAKSLDPENPVVRGRLERLQGAIRRTPRTAGEPQGHPRLGELEIRVDDEEAAALASGGSRDRETDDGLVEPGGDLAKALEAALDEDAVEAAPAAEAQGISDVLKVFRDKVAEEVETSDYRTHYELGIAYKEMGLLDEAIAELQHAARDEARLLECSTMLGLCFRQKGMPEQARDWYLRATESGLGSPEQQLGLQFELGETYMELGDVVRARELFQRVAVIDDTYRDVASRLQEVEGKV